MQGSKCLVWLIAAAVVGASANAQAQSRKLAHSADDLPRFTYSVPGSAAELLAASADRFDDFAKPVVADIDRLLDTYDIADKATLRAMLHAKLGAEIASGREDKAALKTIIALRAQEDKPEGRLNSELAAQAFLEARAAGHEPAGTCPAAFSQTYARLIGPLPWSVVGTHIKMQKGFGQVATPAFVTGFVSDLQPTLDRTHALTNEGAWRLVGARTEMDVLPPCRTQIVEVLTAYIAKHDMKKPDIWSARNVTLTSMQGLQPVPVAIWDSGFDRSLFTGQLLLGSDGKPVRGPAFDVVAMPASYDLLPLTPEQAKLYPSVVADEQGVSDLQNGVDSSAAAALRKKVSTLTPAQAQAFFEVLSAIGGYSHGTHVTGIAAKGDPAIRLTSAIMTYDTKPVPTPPSDLIQARLKASYQTIADWCRAHRIRVVNMSFGVRPSDYETVLEKNGIGKTGEERKQLARHYFAYERQGFLAAFRSAPDILFVAAAMNNDADNAADETVPSSLELPNLITVGAVDEAGERTGFTSTGKTVRIYASGYNVESVVPGGAHVQESGTSMAAPQVTNLAAKLIALDPSLTPAQTIAVILGSADSGAEPNIRLLNPKKAVAMLMSHEGGGSLGVAGAR